MKILGLTGSIATGKSFVAEKFRYYNIPVFSSDKEVTKLLSQEEVIKNIQNSPNLSPAVKNDIIQKDILSKIVFENLEALNMLEKIIHPLLNKKREEFLKKFMKEKFVLLEIPLLFEKKYQTLCNKVITTYCSKKIQVERALRRKNIDSKRLEFIIKQQIPSNIKARLADYLVYTEISYQYTELQLEEIFRKEGIK